MATRLKLQYLGVERRGTSGGEVEWNGVEWSGVEWSGGAEWSAVIGESRDSDGNAGGGRRRGRRREKGWKDASTKIVVVTVSSCARQSGWKERRKRAWARDGRDGAKRSEFRRRILSLPPPLVATRVSSRLLSITPPRRSFDIARRADNSGRPERSASADRPAGLPKSLPTPLLHCDNSR